MTVISSLHNPGAVAQHLNTQQSKTPSNAGREDLARARPQLMCPEGSDPEFNLRRLNDNQLQLATSVTRSELGTLRFLKSQEFVYQPGQGAGGTEIELDDSGSRKVIWHQVEWTDPNTGQAMPLWITSDKARPCNPQSPSSGSPSRTSLLPLENGRSDLPTRPSIKTSWLDGRPRTLPFKVTEPVAILPSDRCKAGFLFFGGQFCMIHGKGSESAGSLQKGTDSFGRSCEYPAGTATNGSTPIPPPEVTISLGKTGSDPNSPLGKAQRLPMSGNFPGERDALVIHAGRANKMKENVPKGVALDFNIEGFNTFGCIRTREECQEALAKWVRGKGGSLTLKLREITGDSEAAPLIEQLRKNGRVD